ncbi:MAG: riboflavin synthase [Parachlamydiaceae bacterium]|nr:riboflavin synthase [Parachlamydiaceae bacterium]
MFTGLIEELGQIQSIQKNNQGIRFQIGAALILEDAKIGDSISVNGCCLTITDLKEKKFYCDAVPETIEKTNFSKLQIGDKVNLERSVKLQDRLGGHLVQGHVDNVGQIIEKKALKDGSWWVTISAPSSILRYVILKGSITVDGVSLTITERSDTFFSFAMIPHTAQVTNLGLKNVGDLVNLECDMIAKYVEHLLIPHTKSTFLR